MKLLKINKITTGMVVGKDLISPTGQCLVSKGSVLTDSAIKSLRQHNVSELHIEESREKKNYTDEEIKDAEKECIKKVEERFIEKPEDPMMKAIFKAVLKSEALEYLKCSKVN